MKSMAVALALGLALWGAAMPASAAGHRNCTYQAVTSVQHQAAGDGYRSRVVTTTYRQCGQGHGKVIGVTYGAWGPVS